MTLEDVVNYLRTIKPKEVDDLMNRRKQRAGR